MKHINKVTLVGRLGRDPEIRATRTGSSIGSFSMATDHSWKDKSGEWQKKTEWHKVVVFDERLIDAVIGRLKVGSTVFVEGALQTRKWQDQSGADRYVTEVVVQFPNGTVGEIMSQATQSSSSGRQQNGQSPPARSAKDDFDDEIPF